MTNIEEKETFNITTFKNHNFIANGIYTHNTLVAAGIIQILGLPSVFLTHRITLLKQTKANYKIKELRETIWYFCLPCILLLAFTKK